MKQASGTDAVLDVLLTTGTLLDMYGVTGSGTNWTAEYYGTSDGINGPGFGTYPTAIGTTAIGSPQAGGTILASDIAAGVIPHGLTMACDYGYEGGSGDGAGDQVAPAVSNDDGGGGGPLPQGGLLFIPPGTSTPLGLSAMGKQLWVAADRLWCLRHRPSRWRLLLLRRRFLGSRQRVHANGFQRCRPRP